MPLHRQRPSYSRHEEYKPFCPHYPACYGCPFIKFPYPQQLERKRRIVVQALATYATLTPIEVPPLIPSSHRFGYRARVKLVVRKAQGVPKARGVPKAQDEVLVGIYMPESHQVADISGCPVHPDIVNRVVQYLKKEIPKLRITPYDEHNDSGQLRYLDIRYSFWRRDLLLTLVTRHADLPHGRELAWALQRRFPFISGIVQNINEERGNVIWGERFRPLAGRDAIMERIGFLKLKFPVGVFSQANPPVARQLYETVVRLSGLKGQATTLDLYCGVGPLSFYLATASRLVWGVDENRLAISTAKENARLNGFHNCRFFVGEVAEKVQEAKLVLPQIDLVVLNPPRKGVNSEALTAILSLKAPKIIYVSCNQTTLARDLDQFVQQGYQLLKVQPFDMFPQTEKVETVALLERAREAGPG